MQNILQFLSKSVRPGFIVDFFGKNQNRHPALISYCCNISDGMNMCGMKHDAMIFRCIWCLKQTHDIRNLENELTRIAHKMDELFKSNNHHYTVYVDLLENGSKKSTIKTKWERIYTGPLLFE